MIRMAYLSTAASPPSPAELESLIAVSQRNNAAEGITGLLCHHDGSFLQFLEGEDAAIERVYARITADRRHHSLLKLYRQHGKDRLFGDWTMAVVKPQEIGAEHRRFCQGLRELELDAAGPHAKAVLPFLESFRSWLR